MSEAEVEARRVWKLLQEWTECREDTIYFIQDTAIDLQAELPMELADKLFRFVKVRKLV